jgi:hypothetical protein
LDSIKMLVFTFYEHCQIDFDQLGTLSQHVT